MNDATPGPLRRKRWSPYVVGALIGVLSWITFLTMDKALGTSSSMVHAAGALEYPVAPGTRRRAGSEQLLPEGNQREDAAHRLAGDAGNRPAHRRVRLESPLGRPQGRASTDLWQWRFGPSEAKSYAWAFGGGAVMLFGARMAGGCTSGHGISGSLQLALSSWVFFFSMFASGVLTAFAIFGPGGRRHVLD